jgi:hypothetical protein
MTARGLNGRRRAAVRTSPSSVKSPCGGPPTASTPGTHDQPEQDSCALLPPSGNTTSTGVSPGAWAMLTERLLDPHETAGHKIDSAHPNHPRSDRPCRRLAPACSAQLPTRSVTRNQTHTGTISRAPTFANVALVDQAPGCARRGGACPRCGRGPRRLYAVIGRRVGTDRSSPTNWHVQVGSARRSAAADR